MARPAHEPVAEPAAVPASAEILAWLATAGAEPPRGRPADAEATRDRPTDAERARATEEESLPPRTRLRRRRGDSAHLVECFDTAVAAGPVHVTVLAP